jgi:hypothetical protein
MGSLVFGSICCIIDENRVSITKINNIYMNLTNRIVYIISYCFGELFSYFFPCR